MLYPIKCKPIYKTTVWGGNALKQFSSKAEDVPEKCGESWEISSVPDNISVVKNGFLAGNTLSEIIETYMSDLVGEFAWSVYGAEFPLLIKFIDANDVLSVQVHPDDFMAYEKHRSLGKTEMWYILKTQENASIIHGFNQPVSPELVRKAIQDDALESLLWNQPTLPGDVFFIPAGTVHAIGKGVVLVEIQQNSNITYRLYDWNRMGLDGKPRDLHIEDSIETIDYTDDKIYFSSSQDASFSELVNCDYFTTNKLIIENEFDKDLTFIDSFVVYICIDGTCNVKVDDCDEEILHAGETLLIPAILESINIQAKNGTCTLLEVYIEEPIHDN